MSPRLRTASIWVALILMAVLALFVGMSTPEAPQSAPMAAQELGPDQMAEQIRIGEIGVLAIDVDGALVGWGVDGGGPYRASAPLTPGLLRAMGERGQHLAPLGPDPGADEATGGDPLGVVMAALLIVLVALVALVVWLRARKQQAGAGGIMEMRKTTARALEERSRLRFADVGGAEPIKDRLADVIACLKDPEGWAKAGVRLPRGVLLEGPPGCGKTMMARAVAGEAGVPVFVLSASELVEMFVGVGASRVRDTFEQARKAAPAVLFIDELDAIGRRRGAGATSSAHDEREQTLNQLLVCLDGAEAHKGKQGFLVVMAATNRADILDPALLRPGRFDVKLRLGLPDLAGRRQILALHTRGRTLGGDVDLDAQAEQTEGMSGAELELMCVEATLRAVRRAGGPAQTPLLGAADLAAGRLAARSTLTDFDVLDAVLIESQGQLARPAAPLQVRLTLADGAEHRGRLLWMDSAWIKLEGAEGGPAVLLPKAQLRGAVAEGRVGAADAEATLRQLPRAVGVG
jgi:AAA+ superfamily predicted ATPase